MGKFNTYRYLVLEDVDEFKRNGRRRNKPIGRCQRTFVLSLFIGIVLLIGFYSSVFDSSIDYLAVKYGYAESMHSVVIDTNDRRSELYIYNFHKYVFGNKLCLDKVTFVETKPGLTSSVYENYQGEQLVSFLKQSCSIIASEKADKIPLIFKISSVPSQLSLVSLFRLKEILQKNFEYLASIRSPFLLKRENFNVLEKQDELVDLWIAISVLTGDGKNTVVFDMDDDLLHMVVQMKEDVAYNYSIVPTPKGKMPIFIKSYPNLGLMAARLGILRLENPKSVDRFNSSCINSIIKDHPWTYGDTEYHISGPSVQQYMNVKESWISVSSRVPIVNITACLNIVQKYVDKNLNKMVVPTLLKQDKQQQPLFFFGHFFKHASDLGLFDPMKGGTISVKTLSDIKYSECNFPNVDQPWVCLDLLYIFVLLERIVGVDSHYQVTHSINENQISWTLGAAYRSLSSLMDNRH